MGFLKKMKDILFDEEDAVVETNQVIEEKPEVKNIVVEEENNKVINEVKTPNPVSERELFKSENSFPFPDFDEEEFNDFQPVQRQSSTVSVNRTPNYIEFERKKKVEKRTEYNRFEKVETIEVKEKRKFKPSPIISPVYGVLNEDYKPEDIRNKGEVTNVNINIEEVRKKAFGEVEEDEIIEETPKYEFFEETVTSIFPDTERKEKVKTIDELLEDTSDIKIDVDEDMEVTDEIEVPIIKEEIKEDKPKESVDLEDTLENDLFDLIDSMYESREEE